MLVLLVAVLLQTAFSADQLNDWTHSWLDNSANSQRVITPESGVVLLDDVSHVGFSGGVYVDKSATVYFGKPAKTWKRGMAESEVGVPFVALLDGLAISDNGSVIEVSAGKEWVISFKNMLLPGMSGAAKNARFDAQLAYYSNDGVRLSTVVNYKSNLRDAVFDGVRAVPSMNLKFWGVGDLKKDYDIGADFSMTYSGGANVYLVKDGAGTDYLSAAHGSFNGGIAVNVNANSRVFSTGTKSGVYPGVQYSVDGGYDWSQFSELVTVAKSEGNRQFRVWAFEDGKEAGTIFGLDYARNNIAISSDYQENRLVMDPIYRNVMAKKPELLMDGKRLSINVLKVMFVGDATSLSGKLEVKDIYLERSQPHSYLWTYTKDAGGGTTPPTPVQTYPLTVSTTAAASVSSDLAMQGVVTLKGPSTKSAPLKDGTVSFTDIPAGVYDVSVSQAGTSYKPEKISWNAGSTAALSFVQYQGNPTFSPNPPKEITYLEGATPIVVDLTTLASDAASSSLVWSMSPLLNVPAGLVSFDAANRKLTIGNVNSTWNGDFSIALTVQNPYGASQTASLVVHVTPSNNAPVVLAKEIRLTAGQPISIDLDKTGANAFAMDADNALSTLNWEIVRLASTPANLSLTLEGHLLVVNAPLGLKGTYPVDLKVTDPGLATTVAHINVIVQSPNFEILGAKAVQDLNSDIQVDFSVRTCAEAASLAKSSMGVADPLGGYLSFPATFQVLSSPQEYAGVWSDGQYRALISSASVANGTTKMIKNLINQGALGLSLDVACGGATQNQKLTASGIDFTGPKANVSVGVNYRPDDVKKRSPSLSVSWEWNAADAISTDLIVSRYDALSHEYVQVKSIPLNSNDTRKDVSDLVDGTTYLVGVKGKSPKGAVGGGLRSVVTPSGIYQATLQLGDHQLPSVTGNVCIHLASSVSAAACQTLSKAANGAYQFDNLELGDYLVEVNDPRWMLKNSTGQFSINHADATFQGSLVPSDFIESNSLSLNEEQGTGDLVLKFKAKNEIPNEYPLNIRLAWTDGNIDPTQANGEDIAVLPVMAGTYTHSGNDWSLRWTKAALNQQADLKKITSAFAWRRWNKVTVRMTLDGINVLRGTGYAIQSKYPNRRNVVGINAPSVVDDSRTIDANGIVKWEIQADLQHGSVMRANVCLPSTDVSVANGNIGYVQCAQGEFGPQSDLLEYRLDSKSAYSLNGYDNFVESAPGAGMVVPDYGNGAAGSQWKFWASSEGDYDVYMYWTTNGLSRRFSLTLDSGKSWALNDWLVKEKWNQFGTIHLKKGWNSIGLSVDGFAEIRALSFRSVATNHSAPTADPSTLPLGSQLRTYGLSLGLEKDKIYSARFDYVNEFGADVATEDWFRVSPDGAFSDAVLSQEENTGDLLLRTTETTIDAVGQKNTTLLLPYSATPVVPTSISFNDLANNAGLNVRIARKDIPADFLANATALHGSNLEPIKFITKGSHVVTWSERHCRYWGISCHTDWYSRTEADTKETKTYWTGAIGWTSGHDLRPLPSLTVSVERSTLDSLYLKVEGLESAGSAYRGTAASTVKASWTPGSSCASSTSIAVPARNIFASDENGYVAFRPTLEAAYASTLGGATPSSTKAPSFRHQWLNYGIGGGFYPAAITDAVIDPVTAARVAYLVRGKVNKATRVNLWVAPDENAGVSRADFFFRLRPISGKEEDYSWVSGTAYSTNGSWTRQPIVVTPNDGLILDTGVQILEIRMSHPGARINGIALVPEAVTSMTANVPGLPVVGEESPQAVHFVAPNLTPGTLHQFIISAADRWGNEAAAVNFSASTLHPSVALPSVRLAIDPWDASGWLKVGNHTLTATLAKAMPAGVTGEIKARFYKKDDAGLATNPQQTITMVANSTTGAWEGQIPDLTGFAAIPGQLDKASRMAVEVWVESDNSRGPSSVVAFQVRSDDRPSNSSAVILDGPVAASLKFHVLQSWSEGSETFANLSVPAMQVQEDDTGINELVLRRAKITVSNGVLASVTGGEFASQHCHYAGGAVSNCMDQSEHPLTVGRWAARLDIQGLAYKPGQGLLEIATARVYDDQVRPVRNSNAFQWDDHGLRGDLEMAKDRFWVGNVLASTDEEAFGIEACRSTIRRLGADQTLTMSLRGCDELSGPFLTFPLHMRTSGLWSLMGTAFDSLKDPYSLTWLGTPTRKWTGGTPEAQGAFGTLTSVDVTKSSLKEVFGASLWGYDIKSYTFGQAGITNLTIDVLFPETQVTPKVGGKFQRIEGFTGGSITSTATVMNGKPVLAGDNVTTSQSGTLQLGQTLGLAGVAGWKYARSATDGWTLDPIVNGQLYLTGPQRDGWSIGVNGNKPEDRFALPFKTIVLGPGSFDQAVIGANGSQEVSIDAGGSTTIKANLSVEPGDDGLLVQASSTSVTLGEFFTNKTKTTSEPIVQSLNDVELYLSGEFQLKDVDAIGDLTADLSKADVKLAGFDLVSFIPTKKYQVMANRGRVFVRLFRPSVQLNFGSAEKTQPGSSVQTVVLTTTRLPVAVGASIPVPEGVNLLEKVGLESLGSLIVDDVQLDASTELENGKLKTKLGLEASTLIELGSMFDLLGMQGTKLPLKSARMDFNAQFGKAGIAPKVGATVSLETSPIGFSMDVGWTAKRIQKMFGVTQTGSDEDPAIIRLKTQGWPLSVKYNNGTVGFSLKNWELLLTKDFPIKGLANTSFFLDELSGTLADGDVNFSAVSASGEKSFPEGLKLVEGVLLLGADGAPVKVSFASDKDPKKSGFKITASQIKIGDKTYTFGCNASQMSGFIKVRMDGSIEAGACFELDSKIAIYPIGSANPDIFIPKAVAPKANPEVQLSFAGGQVGFDISNVKIQSKESIWNGENLDFEVDKIAATVGVKGIKVKEAAGSQSFTGKAADWQFGPVIGFNLASIGFSLKDDKLAVTATPKLKLNAGVCDGDSKVMFTFSKDMSSEDAFKLDWGLVNGTLTCDVADFKATATGINVKGSGRNIDVSVDLINVDLSAAAKYIKETWTDAEPSKEEKYSVDITNVAYKDGKASVPAFKLNGVTSTKLYLQIPGIGTGVTATFGLDNLLSDERGITLTDVSVKLPAALGGKELPTNFSVVLNGSAPYVHPRLGGLPKFSFSVPSIHIAPKQGLDDAHLAVLYKPGMNSAADPNAKTPGKWTLEGSASMSLSGAIQNIAVELAMQAPSSDGCQVGICKAVLTLKLASGSRIPIGSTGAYISGLKGGFYDGDYAPPCAKECTGQDLPRGMKLELALFIELQNPEIANGSAGFWVQINEFNFGLNGKLKIVGKADASACLAILQGGSVVHGKVTVSLETPLAVQGYFVMDIWDDGGSKFAAEAGASVALNRAAIIKSRWFKFPRSRWWVGPVVTRMGAFKNGSNGFTTGVRALGKTWGAGYVGGFILGNVGKYSLASPFANTTNLVDGSTISTNEYSMLPLGIDLKGGEVITVAVGSAVGTDWRGSRLALVNPTVPSGQLNTGGLGGTVVKNEPYQAALAYEDTANTTWSDSANIHTMTWTNPGITGLRPYIAIPRLRGTAPLTEKETSEAASTPILRKDDDVQIFASLADPVVDVKATACADGKDVCFSGSVRRFQRQPRTISRTYDLREQAYLKQAAEGTAADLGSIEIVKQQHLLKVWAASMDTVGYAYDTSKADSTIPQELDLSQFEGANSATASLADLSCATASPSEPTTLLLNACRLKNTQLPSGTYAFMLGTLAKEWDPKNDKDEGMEILLDQTRTWATASGADADRTNAALFDLENEVTGKVEGLTVFGSALTGTQSQKSETSTFFVRWNPLAHRDVVGYTLKLGYADGTTSTSWAGRDARWSKTLATTAEYPDRGNGFATIQMSQITEATDKAFMARAFAVPTSITVVPRLRVLKKRGGLIEDETKQAVWTSGAALGQAAVATAPQTVIKPDSTLIRLPLDGSAQAGIEFGTGAVQTGHLASDWTRAELAWVDAEGALVAKADSLGYPQVSLLKEEWKTASSFRTKLVVTAPSEDLLCPSGLDTTICRDDKVVRHATGLGTYRLRVRVWNQGHLTDDAFQESVLSVQVHPPLPELDVMDPDYLIGGRTQRNSLSISGLWKRDGRNPEIRFLDANGTPMSFTTYQGNVWHGPAKTVTELVIPDSLIQNGVLKSKKIRWALPKWDLDSVTLEVSNLTKDSTRWSRTKKVAYVRNVERLACKDDSLLTIEKNYEYGMDWIGFYPKSPLAGGMVFAKFSEIHHPEEVNFTARLVVDERDTLKVDSLWVSPDKVQFRLPSTLKTTSFVKILLSIEDSSAGLKCQGKTWHSSFRVRPARSAAERPTPLLLTTWSEQVGVNQPISAKDQVRDVYALPASWTLASSERIEWSRGTSYGGMVPVWHRGLPSLGALSQPDVIQLRLREAETDENTWSGWDLVKTPPRRLELLQDGISVGRQATLPLGTRLTVGYAPRATRGMDGSSRGQQECRWNQTQWKACPSEWTLDLSTQGSFESRMAWAVRLPQGGTETVYEPVQSWTLQAISLEDAGIKTQPLTLDGERLASLLQEPVTAPLLHLSRSGEELARWEATAPVIRDEKGLVVPQETEIYDPVAKRWDVWFALDKLERKANRTLILGFGDKTVPASPWSGLLRLATGATDKGQVGAPALVQGQAVDRTLETLAGSTGWSSSMWLRWSGAASTLFSAKGGEALKWEVLGDGALQMTFRNMTWKTLPVLETSEPMLVGVDWSSATGEVRFWVNGAEVAKRSWTAEDKGTFPKLEATWTCGGIWCDELRWSAPLSAGAWALRWESERQHSMLWQSWDATQPVRPQVERIGTGLGVRRLVPGATPWQDRDLSVLQVPANWTGAALLPGLRWQRMAGETSQGQLVTLPGAKLCAVEQKELPGGDWLREGSLLTDQGEWGVWCKTLPATGEEMLQVGTGTAPAWFVLPGTANSTGTGTALDQLASWPGPGNSRPTTMVPLLQGQEVKTMTGTAKGNQMVFETPAGKTLMVALKDSPLAHYLEGQGAVAVQTITGTDGDGKLVEWVIYAPTTLPVSVPKDLMVDGMAVVLPAVAVAPKWVSPELRIVPKNELLVLPNGTTVPSGLMTEGGVVPRSCASGLAKAQYARPVRLHLWSAFTGRVPSSPDWRLVEVKDAAGANWAHWSRELRNVAWSEDLSGWLPGPCVSYALWAEELPVVAPDWNLGTMRVRGIGGDGSLRGGQHKVQNLELEYAAAHTLESPQYRMRLSSVAGEGANLVTQVLGLGKERLIQYADSALGAKVTVSVQSRLPLVALRAERLDADSVVVDVTSLLAKGSVRVRLRQNGGKAFPGGGRMVLFRDKDGDAVYTGVDQALGAQILPKLGAGDSVTLTFKVDGLAREYPEELFFAWIETPGTPEIQVGDYLAKGGNLCTDRKRMAWSTLTTERPSGISLEDLPEGTSVVRAHLRDTDGDGRLTERDSTDALWVSHGKVCRTNGTGSLEWCRWVDGATRSEDLAVRDLDGRGSAEILVGTSVLDPQGRVLWELGSAPSNLSLDADEDGLLDQYTVTGTCRQLTLGNGTLAWASGCSAAFRTFAWKDLARHPQGCGDLSLSGMQVTGGGLTVRVANAGTVRAPAGVLLEVRSAAGSLLKSVLLPELAAGKWMDLPLGIFVDAGAKASLSRASMESVGLMDSDASNDERILATQTESAE